MSEAYFYGWREWSNYVVILSRWHHKVDGAQLEMIYLNVEQFNPNQADKNKVVDQIAELVLDASTARALGQELIKRAEVVELRNAMS